MWRIWTRGFGVRDWWFWFTNTGFPVWFAWRVPRYLALWVFIRVCSATGESPDNVTYESAYDAWVAGAGK